MKLFNKYFFIGMATGVVLIILIICVGGYFIYKQVSKNSLEQIKTELLPPAFPEKSRIAIYGRADYSWPLRTLDGRETTLSEFRDKVVFINLSFNIKCITSCFVEVKFVGLLEKITHLLRRCELLAVRTHSHINRT